MFFARSLNVRFLAVLALAFIAMTAAYGLAGSNTVTSKAAGDGQATISGYTVTGTGYTLNSTNPDKIDVVKFNISETTAPAVVKLQLATTGSWFSCTTASTVAPWAYTCGSTAPLNVAVADATHLRVVASE